MFSRFAYVRGRPLLRCRPAFREPSPINPAQSFPARNVTAKNVDTGAARSTVTDAERPLSVLLRCRWASTRFEAAKPGSRRRCAPAFIWWWARAPPWICNLRVGESSQQVTVNGDAPLVGVTTADISGLVGEQQIKDLPLNGRSYDELLTLNPGVVNFTWEKTGGIGVSNSTSGNNFAVAGNRPQQNLFLLNGVEFTGAAENNMQPGGTSQQLLGVDAVREFNLLRDSYGAEYGKRPGAQVLIVTQSGHEPVARIAVRIPAQQRPRRAQLLRSRFRSGLSAQPVRRLARAGRSRRDKTFFFGNYEGFRQHLHQTGVDLVPDDERAQRISALQAGQPGAESLPGVGTGVRRRFAADQRVARAEPRRAGLRRNFGSVQQSAANHSRRLRNGAAGPHFLAEGYAERGLHHRRQRRLHAHQHQRLQHRRGEPARAGGQPRGDARFLAHPAEHGAGRLFARRLFLHRRTDAGHSRREPARLPGGTSDRRGGGGRQRGIESDGPVEPGRKQQRKQSATSRAICSPMRIACRSPRAAIRFSVGAWFQRLQSNENLALSQYGQATFTSLQTFLQGTVGTLLYDPAPTPLGWRSLVWRVVRRGVIRLSPKLDAVARIPRRIHHRLERGARPGVHLHVHRTASSRPSRPSATRLSR